MTATDVDHRAGVETGPPDLAGLLRQANLRVTRPRLAVLDAVHTLPHAHTEQILQAVRAGAADISRQSVYNCLHTLATVGLVRCIQPSGSPARYEARVGDNHHHLICRSCGVIVDVDCAVGAAPCLAPAPSGSPGFTVDEAEVVYWGRCPACAGSPADARDTPDDADGPENPDAAHVSPATSPPHH